MQEPAAGRRVHVSNERAGGHVGGRPCGSTVARLLRGAASGGAAVTVRAGGARGGGVTTQPMSKILRVGGGLSTSGCASILPQPPDLTDHCPPPAGDRPR